MGCDHTANALITADYYGFYSVNWSDHRLGELCFDTPRLLGPTIPSTAQGNRDMNLLYHLHTDKYRKRLHELHTLSKTIKRLRAIEHNLALPNKQTFQRRVLHAQNLMERASAYMRASKQVAVPRVPTSNPRSTTLGKTGAVLRKVTCTYNKSLCLNCKARGPSYSTDPSETKSS